MSSYNNLEEFLYDFELILRFILKYDWVDPIVMNKSFLSICMPEILYDQAVDMFSFSLTKLLYSSLSLNDYKGLFNNYRVFVIEGNIINEMGSEDFLQEILMSWVV